MLSLPSLGLVVNVVAVVDVDNVVDVVDVVDDVDVVNVVDVINDVNVVDVVDVVNVVDVVDVVDVVNVVDVVRVFVFELKQQSRNYRHVGNIPTCRQMSCRLDTLADTTFSCVCDVTSDVSRHVARHDTECRHLGTKTTRRHPTYGAKTIGNHVGTIGSTSANLWQSIRICRKRSSDIESGRSWRLQSQYDKDSTEEELKCSVAQSLAQLLPLARRSQWPRASTQQR